MIKLKRLMPSQQKLRSAPTEAVVVIIAPLTASSMGETSQISEALLRILVIRVGTATGNQKVNPLVKFVGGARPTPALHGMPCL